MQSRRRHMANECCTREQRRQCAEGQTRPQLSQHAGLARLAPLCALKHIKGSTDVMLTTLCVRSVRCIARDV